MVNQLDGQVCGITANIIGLSSLNKVASINMNIYGTVVT